MNVNRREFLRIAGFATALGVGGKAAIAMLSEDEIKASQIVPEEGALIGSKWAMVVDLKKCLQAPAGCTKCREACHRVHNVPDFGNPKDEIKWIWNEQYEHAFPSDENEHMVETLKNKPVVVLCNHCENPPCVRVCPTKATWKRKDGIVMMDFHRCIGCRFCMAACPYGSRSFNWRDPRPFIKEPNPKFPTRAKGVVEKCNFCNERLARGQLPACVEVCPQKAMVFGDMEDPDSQVRQILRENFSIRRKPELGTNPQVYYIV